MQESYRAEKFMGGETGPDGELSGTAPEAGSSDDAKNRYFLLVERAIEKGVAGFLLSCISPDGTVELAIFGPDVFGLSDGEEAWVAHDAEVPAATE